MTNSLITIAIISVVFFQLNHISEKEKKEAYKWWYLPWLAFVFSGLMYLLYHMTEFPDWSFLRTIIYEEYQCEAIFSLLCMAIWIVIKRFLKDDSTHKLFLGVFHSLFATDREDKDKILPFPYFIDEEGVVKAKVGQVFYRWTIKSFVFILSLIYIVYFLLLWWGVLNDFYLISSFGILGLMPLIDYYIYLCSEVPVEKEIIEGGNNIGQSDFDELWQLYIDTFNNYSVAWKKTNMAEQMEQAINWEKDNNDDFNNLMDGFMDKEKHSNFIIEKYDILSAFIKLETIFDFVENNGRHILIALDIPNHFSKSQQKSFTDDIAAKLTEILRKNFNVYGKSSAQSSLNNSIVVAPLSLLTRQVLNEDWMRKIGLITVVNIFDKGVSNLYECRKFSYILQSVNKDYQIIFITPHRKGMEPSLKNTWLMDTNVVEKRLKQFSKGEKQFFIGYDFEDFKDRLYKIFITTPTEPLYSGSELAPLALSSRIGEKAKVITPVHYLDLAYFNAIEGKEELAKFYDLINKTYFVQKKDINDNYINHLLPVDHIPDKQVFSIIYDVDNNAPIIYSKWMHLGYKENFSIVVSKPYLFRDYFNTNHDYFVIAPFVALQPHLCKSRLTLAIILLNMLQKAEMEEKSLRELLRYYYSEREIVSVSGIIKNLFNTYFSSDLASMLRTNEETIFEKGEYRHLLKYNLFQLTAANTPSYLEVVTVKDESGNSLLDLLFDLLYQNYDKGQIHSFSGKPYIIKEYNYATKTLSVSSINNSNNDILFYKPIQIVTIGMERTPIEGMNTGPIKWHHPISDEWISITFEGFETNVHVKTKEWYEFHKYAVNGCQSYQSNSPDRFYPHGKVLKISFGYMQKDEYRQKKNQIRKSLQLLFYEAMQSVFPHHAQYLIISSIGDGDKDLPWIFNKFTCSDDERDNILSFYFIEDAHIDLGLIGALSEDKENIWYILKYIYDYLIWLTEGGTTDIESNDNDEARYHDIPKCDPTVYDQYLERKNFDKYSFLKYGRKKLPDYFEIDLLINFIKDLFQDYNGLQKINVSRQTKIDVIGTCDFCGKKMKNSEMKRLDDGRMRCSECSKDAVDTNEQFEELCDKVKEAFLLHLNIDFSTITHRAKLVSAVELHKVGGYQFSITNGYDIRRIVGLACDREEDKFYVENGYKPNKTFGIIAHEMTHIWEYNDPDFRKVRKTNEDLVEGLAVWTDLFLSEKNGSPNIESDRKSWLVRNDEYGRGLRFIMENCPDDPYGYIREKAKEL